MKRQIFAAAVLFCVSAGAAMAQPAPDEIIAQGDKDGDKALSKVEWEAMGIPFPFPAQADANKDGKIDAVEFAVLIAQGPPQ